MGCVLHGGPPQQGRCRRPGDPCYPSRTLECSARHTVDGAGLAPPRTSGLPTRQEADGEACTREPSRLRRTERSSTSRQFTIGLVARGAHLAREAPEGGSRPWRRAADASQSGARRSSSAQKACSESVSPTGRNRRAGKRATDSIPGTIPLCTNSCMRPPSSRAKGCVFRRTRGPCVALLMWASTVELRAPCDRRNARCGLSLAASGSRTTSASPPCMSPTPHPSRWGPVSPPWRAKSSSDRRTFVGWRALIAKSSHMVVPASALAWNRPRVRTAVRRGGSNHQRPYLRGN